MSDVTNNDDIIDTRDLIAAIDALAADIEEADIGETDENPDAWEAWKRSHQADVEQLAALRKFAAECEDFDDYSYGVILIRDSYFQTYAMDLADDIGAIPADVSWPLTCIDWAQAARELQMDYTPVTFDGVTYWGR